MEFRRAFPGEFYAVRAFYWGIIDAMEGSEYDPGWRRGVYPSDAGLTGALSRGELYLLLDGDVIAAAAIVNNEYNPGYEGVPWGVDAPPERVYMIHALGVGPGMQGRGVGGRAVDECLALSRSLGAACVRLDVLRGNAPAERLYLSRGFRFVEERAMYYEDTGWTQFRMFERAL